MGKRDAVLDLRLLCSGAFGWITSPRWDNNPTEHCYVQNILAKYLTCKKRSQTKFNSMTLQTDKKGYTDMDDFNILSSVLLNILPCYRMKILLNLLKTVSYQIKRSYLRLLVHDRRLSAKERIANRLGYFGTAFIMISPYLLPYGNIGAITYVIGGIVCIPQVWVAKQWNLVVINLNVIIGYGIYIFK